MIDCDENTCKKLMLVYTAVAILVFFAIAYTSLCAKPADYSSTSERIANIAREQQQIGTEIAGARAANERAGEANERAARAITDSQRTAKEIATGIDSIKSQIKECRELAERNTAIIDSLIGRTGAVTQAGSGNES